MKMICHGDTDSGISPTIMAIWFVWKKNPYLPNPYFPSETTNQFQFTWVLTLIIPRSKMDELLQ